MTVSVNATQLSYVSVNSTESYVTSAIVGAQLIISSADLKFVHENVFPREYH